MPEPRPTTNLREPRQWVPVDAPLRGKVGERSPATLVQVALQFDVATNPRYQPKGRTTYCNIFASDVTRALGAEVPHWLDGRELNCNATLPWLEANWREVSRADARARAAQGFPAVAIWRNPKGGPGHIALLLPHTTETRIAQAGRECFFDGRLERGFGSVSPIRFFTHD